MAGLPVISSDNPLVIEVILENDAGICIKQVNPITIAEAVKEILTREDFLEMKARIAVLAREKYNWDIQAQEYIRFYREIETEVSGSKT